MVTVVIKTMTAVELQNIEDYIYEVIDGSSYTDVEKYIKKTIIDIPNLLDEVKRLREELFECKNTFKNIDALVDLHRLIEEQEADDLANAIISLISELEQKVGEIT